jgi:tetratricopeptide (TPR) repeat protein
MNDQQIRCWLLLLFLGSVGLLEAQTEHSSLLEGSQAYQDGNFNTAINWFQKVVEHNDESIKGHYNLGNALYKNKQYEAASKHFQQAAEQASDDQTKANALYNLGNSHLAQAQSQKAPNKNSKKQLESAIDAYKAALRNNPSDYDAKNNLATAYKLLRQQQPPEQQQNQQNKEQQNQQDEQDKQDEEQQDAQNGKQGEEQQDQEQAPPNPDEERPVDNTNDTKPQEISPEEISKLGTDRLLQIAAEADKNVQERLMQRQRRPPQTGGKKW